jgi:phosphotransferase system HPr (HPr) family protein
MASGGSVLGILTLGAEKGAQLRLEATGEDAQKVLDNLRDLIDRKFDEE